MAFLPGLAHSANLASHLSESVRRQIFHKYPNGAIPLAGILSMLENDPTDKAEFGWYEKSLPQLATTHVNRSGTKGPFGTGADADAVDNFEWTAETSYKVSVTSSANMTATTVLLLNDIPLTAGGTTSLRGIITAVDSATKVTVTALATVAGVDNRKASYDTIVNSATRTDPAIVRIGTANPEASLSGTGFFQTPDLYENYTQIFRTPFNSSTTQLKAGMKWDETGHYAEQSHDALLRHMMDLEMALLWGIKSKMTAASGIAGTNTNQRTMGGIKYFLEQYEANNGAPTSDDDPEKRIIANTGGTMSLKRWNSYMQKLFKVTNQRDFTKLCLCGGGFLQVVNDLLSGQTTFNIEYDGDESFRFKVTAWEGLFGKVLFLAHPLFNHTGSFNNSGMFIDVLNLNLRPLNDRDTQLRPEIQPNNADYREDEFLTEIGMENIHAESHMLMNNVHVAA